MAVMAGRCDPTAVTNREGLSRLFSWAQEKRHPVIGGVAWWLKKGVMQSTALRLLLYANFIFIILDAPKIPFRTSNGNPVYPDMLD